MAHGPTPRDGTPPGDRAPRQLDGRARAATFVAATLLAYGALLALHRAVYTYEDARYWAGLNAARSTPAAERLERELAALDAAPKPIAASMAELARSERARLPAITPEGAFAPPLVGWAHSPTFEAALAAQRAWRTSHTAPARDTRGAP